MPMQVTRCPTCGREIGGRNHVAVGGVSRLGTTEDLRSAAGTAAAANPRARRTALHGGPAAAAGSRVGYHRDDLNTTRLDSLFMGGATTRPGAVAIHVLRLLMHMVLHVSGSVDAGRRRAIADAVLGDGRKREREVM